MARQCNAGLKIGARSNDDSVCMDNWLTVSQRDTRVVNLSWICFVIDVLIQSLRYLWYFIQFTATWSLL